MVNIELSNFDDVRALRKRVGDLARAASLHDPEAAVVAAAELANNCVEHGGGRPGPLRIGRRQGRLSLQFENPCQQRPDWRTRKPVAVAGFRTGGYGLEIARALARSLNCRWKNGRVVVRAELENRELRQRLEAFMKEERPRCRPRRIRLTVHQDGWSETEHNTAPRGQKGETGMQASVGDGEEKKSSPLF